MLVIVTAPEDKISSCFSFKFSGMSGKRMNDKRFEFREVMSNLTVNDQIACVNFKLQVIRQRHEIISHDDFNVSVFDVTNDETFLVVCIDDMSSVPASIEKTQDDFIDSVKEESY